MKEYWKNKFRHFSPDELDIIKEALMEVITEYDIEV